MQLKPPQKTAFDWLCEGAALMQPVFVLLSGSAGAGAAAESLGISGLQLPQLPPWVIIVCAIAAAVDAKFLQWCQATQPTIVIQQVAPPAAAPAAEEAPVVQPSHLTGQS